MKVIALGKIAQNKFCNLSEGTVFSFLNAHLEVEPEIYMKILHVESGKSLGLKTAVNLRTGVTNHNFHPSTRCKIFQDACVVLDPIEK